MWKKDINIQLKYGKKLMEKITVSVGMATYSLIVISKQQKGKLTTG